MFSVVSVGVSIVSAGVFVVAAEVSVVSFMFFQLNASFNPVWITLFFNCWYAPTIIANSTSKCKISKCFCKSTLLLLKNDYLSVN